MRYNESIGGSKGFVGISRTSVEQFCVLILLMHICLRVCIQYMSIKQLLFCTKCDAFPHEFCSVVIQHGWKLKNVVLLLTMLHSNTYSHKRTQISLCFAISSIHSLVGNNAFLFVQYFCCLVFAILLCCCKVGMCTKNRINKRLNEN